MPNNTASPEQSTALNANDFANRLQALRRRAGLSQADLARAVDLSRDIIGKYERASHTPSAEVAVHLARALEVSVGYLLGAEDAARANDPDAERRLRALAELGVDDRNVAYRLIDALVRDARAREAYAV